MGNWISSFFSPTPKRNIVLIGNSGNGKSSAGNTILGKTIFPTKVSANAVTTERQRSENTVNGKKITVVDTPDFFDTEDNDKVKSKISRTLVECAEGVHAFVIVLKVGTYKKQEKKIVENYLKMLKNDVLKHTVILFTHGDQLEGQTIDEFVKTNPQLQELVDKCGGRCHVIDNKYWNDCDSRNKSNRVQVKNLLETIDTMVEDNDCYTNELFQKLEEDIQKEMKENVDNLPQEEKREKAKDNVHKTTFSWVKEISKWALFSALMGVRDVVVELVKKHIEAYSKQIVGEIGSKIIAGGAGGALKAMANFGFKG